MLFPLNQILNVSPNLQIAIYLKDYSSLPCFFFDDVEKHQFPSYCTTSYLNLGEDFSPQSPEFYSCIQFEIRKDWLVDFAKLWTRESDSVYNHVS